MYSCPGDTTFNSTPVLKQKLANMQQVESNNHLRGGIINPYNSIDTSWIVASIKMGYRYAVVWFDGVWADTEDFNTKLLTEIDRINNSQTKVGLLLEKYKRTTMLTPIVVCL